MDTGHLMEVRTIEKPHQDFDYWSPNRGGCKIGGCLMEIGLQSIVYSLAD